MHKWTSYLPRDQDGRKMIPISRFFPDKANGWTLPPIFDL